MRKYTKQIIIAYDSDQAGQMATLRGLEILIKLGCDVRILQIEDAKDPDEYITKNGKDKFEKLVDQSISLVEFKVKVLQKNLNLDNTKDKINFLNEIAKILSQVDNKIEQEVYIEKISKTYNISKEAIHAETNKNSFNQEQENMKNNKLNKNIIEDKIKIENVTDVVAKRENIILQILINNAEEFYEKIKAEITENDFKIQENKEIIKKIYESYSNKDITSFNTNKILDYFSENQKAISILSRIMAEDEINSIEAKKMLDNILDIYKKEKLIKRKNEIIEILTNKDKSNQDLKQLEKELQHIIIKISKIN